MKKKELLARIEDLEQKVRYLESRLPPIINTYEYRGVSQLPIPCQHEYPIPWLGIVPPACIKCGRQSSPTFTVIC